MRYFYHLYLCAIRYDKICRNLPKFDKICQNNNIGLNEVLSKNKKLANSKYKRVMLSGNE